MRTLAWIFGAVITATAAFLMPWSLYGSIDFRLTDFPGWGFYLVAAAAQQTLAGWSIAQGGRPARWPGLMVGLSTAGLAGLVSWHYDDSAALFDSMIIPLVFPTPGPGGFVAILGAVITMFAQLAPGRAQTTAAPRPPTPSTASGSVGLAGSPVGSG